jgi:hypothetical protein
VGRILVSSTIAVLAGAGCTTTHEAMPDAYAPIDARRANPDTNADVTHVPYVLPDAPRDAVPFPDAVVHRRLDETGWCGESGGNGCVDPDDFPCGCFATPDSPTVCVDTSTDDAHCGECNRSVSVWARCRDGIEERQRLEDFWRMGLVLRVRDSAGASWTAHPAYGRLREDVVDAFPPWYLTRDGGVLYWVGSDSPRLALTVEAASAIDVDDHDSGPLAILGRSGHLYVGSIDEVIAEPVENVAQVRSLDHATRIVRTIDGRVLGRGYLPYLGIGVEAADTYVEIPFAGPVTELACSNPHCCAVLLDGSTWCWGVLEGDRIQRTPARVEGIDASGGLLVSARHLCVRDASAPGGVQCWLDAVHPFADMAPRTPTLVRTTHAALCAWFEEPDRAHGSIQCEASGRTTPYTY